MPTNSDNDKPCDGCEDPRASGSTGPMSTAGVADAISIEDSSGYEHSDLRRCPFVSRHREAIDYIATDSTESRCWAVPDQNASAGPSRIGTTLARARLCVRRAIQKRNSENLIEFLLPYRRWLKAYDWKESTVSDVVAGLTVGVMVVEPWFMGASGDSDAGKEFKEWADDAKD